MNRYACAVRLTAEGSPDGRWIAFDRGDSNGSYYSNISLLPVRDPGKFRRLTKDPTATYFDLSWGRD